MKAILKYPGSKWRIADWVISFFPPHKTYLEPFFGSGAVLFNKPRSRIETINDLDGDVVNFFTCLRENPGSLAAALYAIPYARDVYDQAYKEHARDMKSLEKAVNFCIRLNMGYGCRATEEKVGWRNDIKGRERAYAAMDWATLPERVIQAAERLRGVQIENQDAVKLMERYNFPDVLVYLDPPYMPGTRGSRALYACEMNTEGQHKRLLKAALAHKGSVLISGYNSALYDRGRVTPEQHEFLKAAAEYGYYCAVCYGAEEAIQTIREYVCLHPITTGRLKSRMEAPNACVRKDGKVREL